ncbi:MAG: DUF308 domain-containing protein [Pseudomonadota bacterium]
MNDTLLKSWWMLALRGAIAILFGAAAMLLPAITLVTLAALFAAFALTAGAVSLFAAIRNRANDDRWWVLFLLGAVSVVAGIVAALNPGLTAVALILLVGANAFVTGVLDIIVAVRVRKHIKGESLLALNGIASIVFGLVALLFPLGAGALALAYLIGFYAMLTGVMLLALSLQVRSWARLNVPRSSGPAGAV